MTPAVKELRSAVAAAKAGDAGDLVEALNTFTAETAAATGDTTAARHLGEIRDEVPKMLELKKKMDDPNYSGARDQLIASYDSKLRDLEVTTRLMLDECE